MQICTNDDCGQICATYKDMVKQRDYRCKQEDNAYRNKSENGIIDRRAPYGFGVPNIDKRLFGDKAHFGKITQTWNCTGCNYSRENTIGAKSLDTARAMHGYTSWIPNERWWVDIKDEFQEQNPQERNGDKDNKELTCATEPRRIKTKTQNNRTIFICGYFAAGRNSKRGNDAHVGKTHREIKAKNVNAPYFPSTLCNLGYMRVHFKKNRCANEPQKQAIGRWAEIVNAINIEEGDGGAKAQNTPRNSFFARMEILWAIPRWECTWRWCKLDVHLLHVSNIWKRSLRCHLAVMRRRTKTGKALRPYSTKEEQHIGHLKNAYSWIHWETMQIHSKQQKWARNTEWH